MIEPMGQVRLGRVFASAPALLGGFPAPGPFAFVTTMQDPVAPALRVVAAFPIAGPPERIVSGVAPLAVAGEPSGRQVLVLTRASVGQAYCIRRYTRPDIDAQEWDLTSQVVFGPDGNLGNDWPMPDLRGMVVDGRGVIFLPDAANGLIWRVSQDLATVVPIAGRRPPEGTAPWDFPADAYRPSAIAVTPDNDLVVISGNAVLQITQPDDLAVPAAPPAEAKEEKEDKGDYAPPPDAPPLGDLFGGEQGKGDAKDAKEVFEIRDFRPLKMSVEPDEATELRWRMDGAATGFTLWRSSLGELPMELAGNVDHHAVQGIRRRETFRLTAVKVHPGTGERTRILAETTVGTQGIDVLAGDAVNVKRAYLDGPLAQASWRNISGLLYHGGLYFAEGPDHTVRRMTAQAPAVEAFAGLRGRPQDKRTDSPANLNNPGPMAYLDGYVYIVDTGSRTIKRRRADGQGPVELFAGIPGVAGKTDGKRLEARFNQPVDIAADPANGALLVADRLEGTIRVILRNGMVHTVNRRLQGITGLALDAQGNLYASSAELCIVQRMRPAAPEKDVPQWGLPEDVGERGHAGFQEVALAHALFNRPTGLLVTDRGLLVADTGNNLIRCINWTTGTVEVIAGDKVDRTPGFLSGAAAQAKLRAPRHLALAPGVGLFISDQDDRALRLLTLDGNVQTLGAPVGTGVGAQDGDNPRFRKPMGIVVNRGGASFVADRDNHAIRRVLPSGSASTVAGRLEEPGDRDDRGADARFGDPAELALDSGDRLFILEPRARRLSIMTPDGTVATAARGAGAPLLIASCPVGPQALVMAVGRLSDAQPVPGVVLVRPDGTREVVFAGGVVAALALDPQGCVSVLEDNREGQFSRLRKFRQAGPGKAWEEVAVTSIGPAGRFGNDTGIPVIRGMAADSKGSLYLADSGNGLIWKVSSDLSLVEIVAGSRVYMGGTRGAKPLNTPLYLPHRIAVTPNDDLIVTAGHALLQITAPGTLDDPWTPPVAPGAAPAARPKRPQAAAAGGAVVATRILNRRTFLEDKEERKEERKEPRGEDDDGFERKGPRDEAKVTADGHQQELERQERERRAARARELEEARKRAADALKNPAGGRSDFLNDVRGAADKFGRDAAKRKQEREQAERERKAKADAEEEARKAALAAAKALSDEQQKKKDKNADAEWDSEDDF